MESLDHPKFLLFWPAGGGLGGEVWGRRPGGGGGFEPKSLHSSGLPSNLQVEAT